MNTVDKQVKVELIEGMGLSYFLRDDLRDSSINLRDYFKLKGIPQGCIIFTQSPGCIVPILVGEINEESIEKINSKIGLYKVLCVYGVTPECGSISSLEVL